MEIEGIELKKAPFYAQHIGMPHSSYAEKHDIVPLKSRPGMSLVSVDGYNYDYIPQNKYKPYKGKPIKVGIYNRKSFSPDNKKNNYVAVIKDYGYGILNGKSLTDLIKATNAYLDTNSDIVSVYEADPRFKAAQKEIETLYKSNSNSGKLNSAPKTAGVSKAKTVTPAKKEKPAKVVKKPVKQAAYKPLSNEEWNKLDDRASKLYDARNRKAFEKFTDRELIELFKRCIYSQEHPWGQAYDDEVYDAIEKRPNAKELIEQAKKEYQNEFTKPNQIKKDEQPEKAEKPAMKIVKTTKKLTNPKKPRISWKMGAIPTKNGADRALWVVVEEKGGKWTANFTGNPPVGREKDNHAPFAVNPSVKLNGSEIPPEVKVQLGMFSTKFNSNGTPIFKKIEGYKPKVKYKLPKQPKINKLSRKIK